MNLHDRTWKLSKTNAPRSGAPDPRLALLPVTSSQGQRTEGQPKPPFLGTRLCVSKIPSIQPEQAGGNAQRIH